MISISVKTNSVIKGLKDTASKKILRHALHAEGMASGKISIIFIKKKNIKKLKSRFFNINKATDVIAFRLNVEDEKYVEGEIYICLSIAKKNAAYYAEPFKKEIARLIIHGGLHLIGYVDNTKKERKIMQTLEDRYLQEMGY